MVEQSAVNRLVAGSSPASRANFIMNNIGIGIVTCNRDKFLDNLIKSLPEDIYTAVVNDGDRGDMEHSKVDYYHYNAENLGVVNLRTFCSVS